MADPLRWAFELRDRMSGPARSMARNLRAVNDELRTGQRASASAYDRRTLGRADISLRGVARGTRAGSAGMTAMGARAFVAVGAVLALAQGLRTALSVTIDLARAAADLAQRFGEAVIQAGMFRQRAEFGLTRILGSPGAARGFLDEARQLSEFLGTDLHDSISAIQDLLVRGFSQREATTIFSALSDLQGLSPTPVDVGRIVLAIGQIRNAGHLQGDELRQLQESGLPLDAVRRAMARNFGVDESQLAGMQAAGQLDSARVIRSILEGIQERGGGGALGSLSREFSQTLPGQLARLQQWPARFFDAVAGGSERSFGGLRDLLVRINALLDPAGATFQRIVEIASTGFDVLIEVLRTAWEVGTAFFQGLFGEATRASDPMQTFRDVATSIRETLVEWRSSGSLDSVRSFGRHLVEVGRALWPVIRGLLIFTAAVAAVVAIAVAWVSAIGALAFALVGGFLAAVGLITDAVVQLGPRAWQWGVDLVQGLIGGITSMLAPLQATASMLGSTVTGAVTRTLGIASPSRVMRELGEYTVLGFEQGLGGGPSIGVGLPTLGSVAARGAGLSVGTLLHVEVHGGDSQGLEERIRQTVLPELEGAFEQLAREAGLA